MEYTEFKQELVSNLQDLIGTRYLVSVQKADFTENLEDFVVIFDSSELVMRCSKMAPIYEIHTNHKVPPAVLAGALKASFGIGEDIGRINKSQVFYRLENLELVQKEYNDIPYQRFLDLAIVFYINLARTEDSIQSRRITNSMLRESKLSISDLMSLANKNTPQLFPYTLRPMEDAALDILDNDPSLLKDSKVRISLMLMFGKEMGLIPEEEYTSRYVLSCEGNLYGSTASLYPELLGSIAEKLPSDFYILPCSRDECVIEAVSEGSELADLKEEVRDVTEKYINEPLVLTAHIYRYNRADGSLKIVG